METVQLLSTGYTAVLLLLLRIVGVTLRTKGSSLTILMERRADSCRDRKNMVSVKRQSWQKEILTIAMSSCSLPSFSLSHSNKV